MTTLWPPIVPCAVSPAAVTSPTLIVPLVLFAEPLPVATLVSPAVIEVWPLVLVLLPPAVTLTPPTLTPGELLPPEDGVRLMPPLPPTLALPAGVVTVTPAPVLGRVPPPPVVGLLGEVVVLPPPLGCVGFGFGDVTGLFLIGPVTVPTGSLVTSGTLGTGGSCANATAGTVAPTTVQTTAAIALLRLRSLRAPPTRSVTKSLSTLCGERHPTVVGRAGTLPIAPDLANGNASPSWTRTNIDI